MRAAKRAHITAPAKINLGLEILGRRADGFHEIRSVLAMIDLVDDLTFSCPGTSSRINIQGIEAVPVPDNLITKAIQLFADRTGVEASCDVSVTKRIPAPSGLGSASSNAAATLLAMNVMYDEPLALSDLHEIASRIGSDVPFFLDGPVASVSGRGTDLSPLPPIDAWMLISIPRLDIPTKTASLYGMLTPTDFTDGSMVHHVVQRIKRRKMITPDLLTNTFVRPLRELVPDLATVADAMVEAGCSHVALSGAGPAHYALFGDMHAAESTASRLKSALGGDEFVAVVPFRSSSLVVENT